MLIQCFTAYYNFKDLILTCSNVVAFAMCHHIGIGVPYYVFLELYWLVQEVILRMHPKKPTGKFQFNRTLHVS